MERMNKETTAVDAMTPALQTHDLSVGASVGYFEMDEVPVRQIDVVEELRKNLAQLEDLQGRMKFIMREVRYLMKM